MTPREAIEILKSHIWTLGSEDPLVEAYAEVVGHITRLEQYAEIVTNALACANRDRPANAVIRDWQLPKVAPKKRAKATKSGKR